MPEAFTYTSDDAQEIVRRGERYRKTTTVHALGPLDHVANVYTQEGVLTVEEGGYIITDGKTVWPNTAEYFENNYELIREQEISIQGKTETGRYAGLTVDPEDLEHLDDVILMQHGEYSGTLDMPGIMHLRNNMAKALGLPEKSYLDIIGKE